MMRQQSKTSGGFGVQTAMILCMLATCGYSAGAQARQGAPPPSTNLGTLVVTPTRTNAPAISTQRTTVKRTSLDLNLQLGTPAGPPTPPQAKPQHRIPPATLHIVSPKYPPAALAQSLRGSVTIAFTIEPDGHTDKFDIVSSTPRGIFDQATLVAVRQWLFRPATVNGEPVATRVTQTLVFSPPLEKKAAPTPPPKPKVVEASAPPPRPAPAKQKPIIRPIHIVAPKYPPKAYRRGIGGSVTVRFTIGKDGRTRHIHILKAQPKRIFNEAARRAVAQWRFQPIKAPTQVTQTIHFTPPG